MREITTELQNEILKIAAKNLPFSEYAEQVSELLVDQVDQKETKELIYDNIMNHYDALKSGEAEKDDELDFLVLAGEKDSKILSSIMCKILDDDLDELKKVEDLLKVKVTDYFSSSETPKTPDGLLGYCSSSFKDIDDAQKAFLVARIKEDFDRCNAAFNPSSSEGLLKYDPRSAGDVFREFISNTELLLKTLALAVFIIVESHLAISSKKSKDLPAKESFVLTAIEFMAREFGISKSNIREQFKEILAGFTGIVAQNPKKRAIKGISTKLAHGEKFTSMIKGKSQGKSR